MGVLLILISSLIDVMFRHSISNSFVVRIEVVITDCSKTDKAEGKDRIGIFRHILLFSEKWINC